MYLKKTKKIKKKFKNFILFSSDFCYISEYRDIQAQEFINFGSRSTAKKIKTFQELSDFSFNDFNCVVEFFNSICKKLKN